MYISPYLPLDLHGSLDEELLLLSEKVCIESAKLIATHNQKVLKSLRELLRKTNSYYSNKIESEGTHPIMIEKAMKKEFSADTKEHRLQRLSLAYIATQCHLEEMDLQNTPLYNREMITHIHKYFYGQEGMKDFLDIEFNNKVFTMIPGEFRNMDVEVNNFVAPSFDELDTLFSEFEHGYKHNAKAIPKAKRLLYALSAHHRVLYAHPFLDGNGRASRLYLDALLHGMGMEGYGLWNISRGLAREADNYSTYLSQADMIQQGATDGRGRLSTRGLEAYIRFMLNICLDQVEYMGKSLALDKLSERIEKYVFLSMQGMYKDTLPKGSDLLFKDLLMYGEIARGDVGKIIGKKQTSASTLIATLEKLDYIESDTPKGAISLKFNAYFASKIIPDLMPEA